MAWGDPKPLAPRPFTGLLDEIDQAARRAEGSVTAQNKLGLGVPEASARTAKAMRGIERMLVALEPYWNSSLPPGKSVKAIIAEHEALYTRRLAKYVETPSDRLASADPEGPQLED